MGDEKLRASAIPDIPSDERILKEGIMNTLRISGKPLPFTYKYVLTEKGIWTLTKKLPFLKQKTDLMPYDNVEFYEPTEYDGRSCCIFHPKERDAINRIFFDDHDGVLGILDQYLRRATDDDFTDDEDTEEDLG
ncbi:MAG: hypothetical protein LBE47_00195 [Methanomassiliicoccaceae archaeon]|jgi:hypothetical protein|nr:hypothetical protein [Methanomassiliicoccaceae archaeon]